MRGMIPRFIFAAALFVGVCAFAAPAPEPSVITLNVEPTTEHPRNSEGSFAAVANGGVIFCYSQFYGGAHDDSAAQIVLIRSDDQGRTWSEPRVIVTNE